MMQIHATITTVHENAGCVAAALMPDNLRNMTTVAEGDRVITIMHSTRLRSVIASVDDYLMNLAVAEDTCSFGRKREHNEKPDGQKRRSEKIL
jgi:hypothetical protein